MFKKKKFAGITAASVIVMSLIIGTTVFASNNDGIKKNADTKVKMSKAAEKPAQTHEDLVAVAAEIGISTTGMSDEQIEAALRAYKQSHQENTNTDGLPPHEHLLAVAKEVGINADGMSDEQIEAALTAYKLSHQAETSKPADIQAIAKKMGIDTNGMTDDQIKATISEKAKTVDGGNKK